MEKKDNSNTGVLNNEKIGERLTYLRESKDLTQEQLAADFNCSRVTISHYETGKHTISMDALTFYRNKFQVSADFILFGPEITDKEKNLISELNAVLTKYSCK